MTGLLLIAHEHKRPITFFSKARIRHLLDHPDALALITFVVITGWLTFPILVRPSSIVIGRPVDDVFDGIWFLAWYKRAIFDLHVSPLFAAGIYYPQGLDLRLSTNPPLFPLLLAPVTALIGAVATYNLTLAASCVVAAWGVYRIVRDLGGEVSGGILAGVAYAFYPNREVYLNGFSNFQLGSAFLPWILVFLLRAEREPKRRGRWCAAAGLAYGLTGAGAWQAAIIGLLIWLVFGLWAVWRTPRTALRTWIVPALAAAVAAAVIMAPQVLFAWDLRQKNTITADFPLAGVAQSGVQPERLIIPGAYNPLFLAISRQIFPLRNGEDGVVYLGLINIALAGVAIARQRTLLSDREPSSLRRALLLLTLLAGLFMLGPALGINGQYPRVHGVLARLIYPVAPELAAQDGSMPILLPAVLVYRFIAPFRLLRHYGRFGMVTILGLATLSGLGLSLLIRGRRPSWRAVVSCLALAVLLVEFNTQPILWTTEISTMRRPVDAWLAVHQDGTPIIEYPIQRSGKGSALYYTLFHGHPIVHGYEPIRSSQTDLLLGQLEAFPAPAALDILSNLGVRYVLYDVGRGEDFAGQTLPKLLGTGRLRQLEHFAQDNGPWLESETYVFELLPSRQNARSQADHQTIP